MKATSVWAALSPPMFHHQFQSLQKAYSNWRTEAKPEHHETLRWMFEEYRVSIFAPELGTEQTVSPKRIDAILEL